LCRLIISHVIASDKRKHEWLLHEFCSLGCLYLVKCCKITSSDLLLFQNAVCDGYTKIVKWFLECGVIPHIDMIENARSRGYENILKLLLEHQKKCKWNLSYSLLHAAYAKQYNMFEMLIQHDTTREYVIDHWRIGVIIDIGDPEIIQIIQKYVTVKKQKINHNI